MQIVDSATNLEGSNSVIPRKNTDKFVYSPVRAPALGPLVGCGLKE